MKLPRTWLQKGTTIVNKLHVTKTARYYQSASLLFHADLKRFRTLECSVKTVKYNDEYNAIAIRFLDTLLGCQV